MRSDVERQSQGSINHWKVQATTETKFKRIFPELGVQDDQIVWVASGHKFCLLTIYQKVIPIPGKERSFTLS